MNGAVPAAIQNMSITGMGFYLEVPVQDQSEISLSLYLLEDGIEDPNTPPLALSGQVMWCEGASGGRGYLAGVRLAPLGHEKLAALESFFERINS